jgi:hypothetical protein
MSQYGIHYRVWAFYNPASGKGEYAVYEMSGPQIIRKPDNGQSWPSWHKAQAVCKKLNQDLVDKRNGAGAWHIPLR